MKSYPVLLTNIIFRNCHVMLDLCIFGFSLRHPEAYSEPSQASKMELFCKTITSDFQPLTDFTKSSLRCLAGPRMSLCHHFTLFFSFFSKWLIFTVCSADWWRMIANTKQDKRYFIRRSQHIILKYYVAKMNFTFYTE